VRYALHESESPDGLLFDVEQLAQRVVPLAGVRDAGDDDELLYVLEGSARATVDGRQHELAPGTAVFIARGHAWSAEGAGRAVSVLVREPTASASSFEVVDLTDAQRASATGGRQFVLGARCESATQFIGLVPPGRAPDHFHTYDEVIYILDGRGMLYAAGEEAELQPGSCVHLPARLVHSLANRGDTELRLLGVFRPAGSPAEAYYPDGSPATVGEDD
jgi:quercetin dioxygenase-like cupin family protein